MHASDKTRSMKHKPGFSRKRIFFGMKSTVFNKLYFLQQEKKLSAQNSLENYCTID